MPNQISSISSDYLQALQIVNMAKPDPTQLIKITVGVTDQNGVAQAGVPVYWGVQNPNANILFYDADFQPYDITNPTPTLADGTVALYVGSPDACIVMIQVGLAPNGPFTGTEIACWTITDDGQFPAPEFGDMDTEGTIAITYISTDDGTYPPVDDTGTAFLGHNSGIPTGSKYVSWMLNGADTSGRGLGLRIRDYNNQDVQVRVPYANMDTNNTTNEAAYMIYGGGRAYTSVITDFKATGTAVVRPDDENNPPNAGLGAPQFVDKTGKIHDKPPSLLSLESFDSLTNLNFNLNAYEGRADTDKIMVYAYLNAWNAAGEPKVKKPPIKKGPFLGSQFQNVNGKEIIPFFLTQSQCLGYCPYNGGDDTYYGYIWIQFVVNNQRYSPTFTTQINFCDSGFRLRPKNRA